MLEQSEKKDFIPQEQRKENAVPEQVFNPDAEIANFKSKPILEEQRLDTYAKAVHRIVERNPSPQAAQRAFEAHLEIMKTLGNAREVLDAIANTRAEKARREEGQSTFTEDILALNKILQVERERIAKENAEMEAQRKILGISPPGGSPRQKPPVREKPPAALSSSPAQPSFFKNVLSRLLFK
ncbi:MAG: hypothetical protein HY001_04785 [Candidatus Portnoybacteria bacterium]|nr:hypothetical protein [Candidatus Portnoybacteria bacterium]